MKASEHFNGESNRFRGKKSAAEYRFAQACHFSVLVDFDQAARGEPRNFQANGVRSNVNSGECRHSATVYTRPAVEIVLLTRSRRCEQRSPTQPVCGRQPWQMWPG